MRAVIQRVSQAQVTVEEEIVGSIDEGFVILLGVGQSDTEAEVDKLWSKISKLRIFEDENEKANLSLQDIQGSVLIISQFTLYANCRRGNRPSFTDAAKPEQATKLYEYFIDCARKEIEHVATGEFGAMMEVSLVNDGPFTITLDTDML